MTNLLTPLPMLVAGCLAITAPVFGQAPATVAAAKALHADKANPVVNIGSIVHVKMGMMREQDIPVATTGIALDATGLILVSRSAINPHGYDAKTLEAGPGRKMEIEASITSLWIQLPDGERMDVEVVLTDPDLDLSLLRPVQPDDSKQPFVAADLSAVADKASVLDEAIVLGRLDKATGWAASVHIARISAVLDTPWPAYVVPARAGNAVYAANGHMIGIVVHLPLADDDQRGGGMRMMGPGGIQGRPVVLPVSQFRALVEQAGDASADKSDQPGKAGQEAAAPKKTSQAPKP